LSCYHVEEEAPDEDDPHNIQITEIEGEREVEGPSLESEVFFAPIKVKKVNIGTTDNPKMASIGDYWDEQTIERITIVTVRFPNYKCILMHTKETHFYLTTY
jgi:hypothetical protein